MLLEVREVSYRYPGGNKVLDKVSYFANRGEVVAIIGPNGAGKTTLLLISAGLLKPERGVVFLDGVKIEDQMPHVRRKIGFVFQNPDDQIFNPTVYDELAFSIRQIISDRKKISKMVYEIAERLALMNVLDKQPYKLSIGEKRLVTMASVLIYEPELLILDEPTSNLSGKSINIIENVINEEKCKGKCIVLSSHNIEFVARVADRVYVLNNKSLYGGYDKREILTDARIMKLADMSPPLIYEVAKILGLKDKVITLEEFLKKISKK